MKLLLMYFIKTIRQLKMYIPDQIGNKHIRVTFSFDNPEQSRIKE